jgi:hypothetical protein
MANTVETKPANCLHRNSAGRSCYPCIAYQDRHEVTRADLEAGLFPCAGKDLSPEFLDRLTDLARAAIGRNQT